MARTEAQVFHRLERPNHSALHNHGSPSGTEPPLSPDLCSSHQLFPIVVLSFLCIMYYLIRQPLVAFTACSHRLSNLGSCAWSGPHVDRPRGAPWGETSNLCSVCLSIPMFRLLTISELLLHSEIDSRRYTYFIISESWQTISVYLTLCIAHAADWYSIMGIDINHFWQLW